MKKRRILLALIMLIISGVSLTTATYAWFTANRAVTVEEIDVKASASGGIQISADAENWSNEVTLTDLKNIDVNYIPVTALKPVTTVGVNGTTGKFDFFLGELDDAGTKVSLEPTADTDNNYIAFDLYFYSATAQKIEFNGGTQVVAKNVGATGDAAATDAGLKSSVRVGFLVQGNDATSTAATAKALNGGTKATQTIWEPNAEAHTTYATNMLGASGVMTTMGGNKKTNDAGAEKTYVPVTDTGYFENIVAGTHGLKTSNTGAYPTGTIFDFPAGINKVRVYVWLEGQDVDNEDTASLGTGVGVKLNFKLADAGA